MQDNNLRSGYGDLGLALDIDMVFEMAYEFKPKECFRAQPKLDFKLLPCLHGWLF